MKEKIRKVLLIVCIVVFCYSAFQLYSIYNKYRVVRNQNKALESEVVEKNEEDASTFHVDFDKLKSMNEDTVAWINIENTELSCVVMQTPDNDFYLRRNFDKEYSFAGTLFIDCSNKPDFSDFNTIMYGHNNRGNSMFGVLRNYRKDENYHIEHPYVDIYVDHKKMRYQIFSVKEVTLDSTLTYYIVENNEELQQNMINEWISTSMYDFGVEVNTSDKILTLSTCVDTLDDAYRFVVNAKLIEVTEA